jgi:hypothetical protein
MNRLVLSDSYHPRYIYFSIQVRCRAAPEQVSTPTSPSGEVYIPLLSEGKAVQPSPQPKEGHILASWGLMPIR